MRSSTVLARSSKGFLDGLGALVNDEKMAKDFKEVIRWLKDTPIAAKVRLF